MSTVEIETILLPGTARRNSLFRSENSSDAFYFRGFCKQLNSHTTNQRKENSDWLYDCHYNQFSSASPHLKPRIRCMSSQSSRFLHVDQLSCGNWASLEDVWPLGRSLSDERRKVFKIASCLNLTLLHNMHVCDFGCLHPCQTAPELIPIWIQM